MFFFKGLKKKNVKEVAGAREGRGRPPRVEETEDDGERDWKKARGKVSTVFHSAGAACFQAFEIAAVVAEELVIVGLPLPVVQTASPGSPKDSKTASVRRVIAAHHVWQQPTISCS